MFNIDMSKHRVVDISLPIVPGADTDRPFEVRRGYLADGAYKYDITNTHTHVGTHVESSSHFYDDGKSIDQYQLEAFYGRGVLLHIDLNGEKHVTADYVERAIGDRLRENDIVVCRNASNGDPKGKRFISEEAALYLKHKKAKMVVLGPNVSMGETVEEGRRIHDVLMRETTFLELVSNLEQITKPEFFVMALPILVKGLDSSWCRAVVIEEK